MQVGEFLNNAFKICYSRKLLSRSWLLLALRKGLCAAFPLHYKLNVLTLHDNVLTFRPLRVSMISTYRCLVTPK